MTSCYNTVRDQQQQRRPHVSTSSTMFQAAKLQAVPSTIPNKLPGLLAWLGKWPLLSSSCSFPGKQARWKQWWSVWHMGHCSGCTLLEKTPSPRASSLASHAFQLAEEQAKEQRLNIWDEYDETEDAKPQEGIDDR
ncbi:hypothetical protein HPB50_000647 [Hyalomma asiaticum]|uniref:Uncharacterized protein n=1 Tax=Hyalomma asiaticum TaxID=266040 RepID=A0ACB7TA50_HYAAI|nr:hypothetical protein HPB50_000647 [Hyalomma asiaticum]